MGFFDALVNSSFNTTEDGKHIFFPWGRIGRGYIVPSEKELKRLRNGVKAFTIGGSLTGVLILVATEGIIVPAVFVAFFSATYIPWVYSQYRRMEVSDE